MGELEATRRVLERVHRFDQQLSAFGAIAVERERRDPERPPDGCG
jgi:hypothetical protein